MIVINLFGAKVYGECEFWFASIKVSGQGTTLARTCRVHSVEPQVLTITGLIILGIILDLGGGPNRDRIGFRYWINPGRSDFHTRA